MRQGAQGWCSGMTQRDGMGGRWGVWGVAVGAVGEGEGGMIRENGIETYILPYVK